MEDEEKGEGGGRKGREVGGRGGEGRKEKGGEEGMGGEVGQDHNSLVSSGGTIDQLVTLTVMKPC